MSPLIDLVALPESLARWELPLLVLAGKSGVILLLALLVTQLLRGAPAALRHLVLSLALAAVLALPVLSTVVPLWRVPVIRGSLSVSVGENAPVSTRSSAPTAAIGVPAVLPDEFSLTTTETGGAIVPQASEATAHAEAPRPARIPWLALLVYGWLAGAALLVLRLAVGMLQLRVLVRRAEPIADPDWTGLAARLASQLELESPVPLRRAATDVVPMVWGVIRPVILLPASADGWTEERRAVVLLHEMAHVKRRDPLAHLVAQLCHALYWPNPLVWIAARRLRDERERACDDHVLATGADPTEYANHLLQIVRSFGMGRAASPALAMARRSQFEGRMLAILDPGLRRGRISRTTATLAGSAALLAVVPLAALAPADATGTEATSAAAQPETRDGIAPAEALAASPDSVPLQARAIAAQYRIAEDLARAIVVAAHAEGLDLGLAVLLVRVESNFEEDRISPRGAVGLTQILPSTAASLEPGVSRAALAQRETNLRLGFRYLRILLDRYHGDAAAALTAYHTGPGAADRLREAGVAVSPTAAASASSVASASPVGRAAPAATAGEGSSRADTGQLIDLIGSDSEKAVFLIQTLQSPLSDAQWIEVVRASERIDSDGARAKVLLTALGHSSIGDTGLRALLHAAAGIDSDGEKATVLLNLLNRHGLPASLTTHFFQASRSIGSDGDHVRVLHQVLARGSGGEEMLGHVLESATRITSDGDKLAVLVALAGRGQLSPALESRYVAVVGTMDSDGDRQRALSALAGSRSSVQKPPVTSPTRTSSEKEWTTELLSSHEATDEAGFTTTRVNVRARDVILRRDGTCIESILTGGRLVIEEIGPASTRSITVTPGPGHELQYRYAVGGVVRPYDAEAQAWLSQRIQQLHRQMKGQTRI